MKEPGDGSGRPSGVRVLIALVVLIAACGGGEPAATGVPSTGAPTETSTMPSDLEAVIHTARADLAARLDVDPAAIEVASAGRVTWSDGSLGCPEPGKMYTQALVDGYRVVLSHDGTRYEYHAGDDGIPFLCERPSLEPKPWSSVTLPESRRR